MGDAVTIDFGGWEQHADWWDGEAGQARRRLAVDDATLTYHLQNGDYAHWFREQIKDEALAEETAALERQEGLSAQESRARLRHMIEKAYTLPAGGSFSRRNQ